MRMIGRITFYYTTMSQRCCNGLSCVCHWPVVHGVPGSVLKVLICGKIHGALKPSLGKTNLQGLSGFLSPMWKHKHAQCLHGGCSQDDASKLAKVMPWYSAFSGFSPLTFMLGYLLPIALIITVK